MSLNSFREIQIIYSKTFYNACELLEESKLLFDYNRNARAYLLAHIAIEELARCIMLASAIMKFKIRALDVKKLNFRQTNHHSKIELAYSLVRKLKHYNSPLGIEDRMEIMLDFVKITPEDIISKGEIQVLDDLKNASFYVNQYQNVTKAPKEMITNEKADEIITSANLLKEFIEINRWQDGENLIGLVKIMNNDQLKNISKKYFEDSNKI